MLKRNCLCAAQPYTTHTNMHTSTHTLPYTFTIAKALKNNE